MLKPIITIVGLQIPLLITGVILIEYVFFLYIAILQAIHQNLEVILNVISFLFPQKLMILEGTNSLAKQTIALFLRGEQSNLENFFRTYN